MMSGAVEIEFGVDVNIAGQSMTNALCRKAINAMVTPFSISISMLIHC